VVSRRSRLTWVLPGALLCAGGLLLHTGVARGEELAPGVTYTIYSAPGPNVVYVVAVDRLRSEYKFQLGYSQHKRNYTAHERTSTIAGRYDNPPTHDVLAAVNGSYFDPSNPPRLIGIGQSDGEMLDTPSFNASYQYHTLMIGPSRQPVIRTNFNHQQGTLTFADEYSVPLTQYNFYMNGTLYPINGVSAFTPTFDSSTRSNFSVNPALAVEVVLNNVTYPMRSNKEVSGIVGAIYTPTAGNAAIPAGGMVLSAWGSTKNDIVAHTHVGDRLRMRFLTDAEEYNNSDNAVTGIGWIIHNGAAYTPGWANLESGAAPYSRNPRTVLAWNNNLWYQVVCDGRSTASVGMTFQEMANFLIATLGATEAVNFDGGGSSTMVVNGTVRNVPSDGSERYVANAMLLVKEVTATAFPFSDPFGPAGRLSGWDDKFTYADVVPFSPPSPGGDGYVLKVGGYPAAGPGGVETTRRGDFGDTDYSVEADVYCEYRPEVAADGLERYGLFARDSGTGALALTNYGKGNCYALVYDSDTGRLRAGKYVDGAMTDFLEASPLFVTASGWHRFRIDGYGAFVRYRLDGVPIMTLREQTHPRGYFGVGYQGLFATSSNAHGTRADSFHAFVDPSALVPGDFDGDGDVDQTDFGHFQACLTGDQAAQDSPACLDARLDGDSDVDQLDFAVFQACLSGSGVAQTWACAAGR
jgi:hypothetical protein